MTDFVPTFWNTLTQHNGRSRTSKVSAGQVAYKKRGYAWDHLNSDILSDLSATAFPGNVQFPESAQGWADIHFNSEYSAKRQILEGNWSSSEDEFVMRMRAAAPTNATGIIHPDKPWQVIYYNAFGQGANLIYGLWHGRATRLEHVIEIAEMPPGDSEFLTYDFYIESNDATAFVGANHDQRPWAGNTGDGAKVEGFSVFLAKGTDSATSRGAVLRTPVCWWSNLDGTMTKKNVRIDFIIQSDGKTVKATKYVRRSDIAEALAQGSVYRADATFNPNPDPESTSVDGECSNITFGIGYTWSQMRTVAGVSANDSSTTNGLTYYWVGSLQTFRHVYYGFDTSSIGAGQQVYTTAIDLAHNNPSTASTPSCYDTGLINVYGATPASNTAIATGDFVNVGTTAYATGLTSASLRTGTNGTYKRWTFVAAGKSAVEVEGVTNLCILMEDEADDTTPSCGWASPVVANLSFYTSETSGTSYDPTLIVTHSEEATGSPKAFMLMMQQ